MSRTSRARLLALGTALLVSGSRAHATDADDLRSAWRYRRSVAVAAADGFAALAVPPEVAARCQGDLRDLRLVDPDGADTSYVVDRLVERETRRSWTARLVDARREPVGPADQGRGRSVWVVDLGEPRSFDTVALEVVGRDFSKRLRLETSLDGSSWKPLRDDAGVFDAPWTPRIRHTTITLAASHRARQLRLTTGDDPRSPPVELSGVIVSATRRGEGEEWTRSVALEPRPRRGSASRYRLDLPPSFPFETLRLDAEEPAFSRTVRLLERRPGASPEEGVVAEGQLYRVQLSDAALAGERLSLALGRRAEGAELVLEIEDGDSLPLRRPRVTVSGAVVRLLFAATGGPLTLYYGNEVTRAPLYDLGSLQERLALSRRPAVATLGPEAENPRFHKAAPLPFTPPRGAPLEVERWRALRRLRIDGADDVYVLTLAPEDLSALRGDLGDLRIVDEGGRQVPYILEPAVVEARAVLAVERASPPSRADGRSVSRYRLALRDPASGKPVTLPPAAVELDVAEAFFDRTARLLTDAPGGRGQRTLFSGRLARVVDPRAADGGAPPPLAVSLDSSRLSELILEVDEGDNTPLTLAGARAVVRVPRVTFKAGPGSYRLLLSNPEATGPRYDLARLRSEVLAHSALTATASAAEPNPAFRRLASDYFSDAPPTLLLWGTLLAAVVVLLLLTARAIRHPPG